MASDREHRGWRLAAIRLFSITRMSATGIPGRGPTVSAMVTQVKTEPSGLRENNTSKDSWLQVGWLDSGAHRLSELSLSLSH